MHCAGCPGTLTRLDECSTFLLSTSVHLDQQCIGPSTASLCLVTRRLAGLSPAAAGYRTLSDICDLWSWTFSSAEMDCWTVGLLDRSLAQPKMTTMIWKWLGSPVPGQLSSPQVKVTTYFFTKKTCWLVGFGPFLVVCQFSSKLI